jgi:hypothetical protein
LSSGFLRQLSNMHNLDSFSFIKPTSHRSILSTYFCV